MAAENSKRKDKGSICYHCKKAEHLKRNSPELKHRSKGIQSKSQGVNHMEDDDSNSNNCCVGLAVSHALLTMKDVEWMIDSGATCHICNDESRFVKLESSGDTIPDVVLDDGKWLKGISRESVKLTADTFFAPQSFMCSRL